MNDGLSRCNSMIIEGHGDSRIINKKIGFFGYKRMGGIVVVEDLMLAVHK